VQELVKTALALPVGTMLPFPRGTVPPGFLEVDGSAQSASVYPDLAAYLGGAFDKGDEGAGFFRLPDTRGEFLRGWDHGRGVDAGRTVGSSQAEEMKAHRHEKLNVDITGVQYGISSGNLSGAKTGGLYVSAPDTTLDSGYPGINTGMYGGTETRPRNIAVMWCIKAWNAPVNQGGVDVAALKPLAGQATETSLGVMRIATQANVLKGEDDQSAVTPLKLKQLRSAQTYAVEFPISPGTPNVIAYPDGITFNNFDIRWKCVSTTGSAGYLIGDEVDRKFWIYNSEATVNNDGPYLHSFSSNGCVMMQANIARSILPHKTTGAATSVTLSSFKLVVRMTP
jgi:hypothetical protein